ncbi:inositol hexakisphosphate and diphosphoinositol-pentakisphosphate kinase-like isoform X2 [Bactrocera tryoni]|uniref:inositol hexakisphosphate and diphosphoinositol-pentakisphosphate kinase-like isoform X2 n=1 Tax=Bactrocera tryoni TaxID=59916 RepID=UPI001A967AD0|nr:inositol hexakisphosphate and diphosphoinositol-pentakisphosphate kinase-like isoform X2 [Bactrocera tryoni]
MSYTELESGYQDLRQSSQQAQTQSFSNERSSRPGFFVGSDGNMLPPLYSHWIFVPPPTLTG